MAIREKEEQVKPFTTIAAIVFALVALVQLVRFIERWPVSIDGVAIPIWPSAVVCIVAALLAVMLWRERRP
jgi:di/tricarboxylate transporter